LSVVAIVVTGLLCVWLWKLACPACGSSEAPPPAAT
jgi:hypothetical protein